MKKIALFLAVGTLLSFTSVVRASDDLAVGDPYGTGDKPVRVQKKHVAHKATPSNDQATTGAQGNQKAGAAQQAPAGNADEAK